MCKFISAIIMFSEAKLCDGRSLNARQSDERTVGVFDHSYSLHVCILMRYMDVFVV